MILILINVLRRTERWLKVSRGCGLVDRVYACKFLGFDHYTMIISGYRMLPVGLAG